MFKTFANKNMELRCFNKKTKKLIIIFFYAMNLTNKKNLNVSHTYAHALSATARQTWLPVDFHSFMNDVLNFS